MIVVILLSTCYMLILASGMSKWVNFKKVFDSLNRSIIRFSGVTNSQLKEAAQSVTVVMLHEKELKLGKCITRFTEILAQIMDDLCPHTLCEYLYELCTTLSEFYDACYCVEKDKETGDIIQVNMSRILMCEATRLVLHQALHILGIEPLEKM